MLQRKVTVFSQTSIDGKLTLYEGASSKAFFALLDDEDFRFIHAFRGRVDGIMIGRRTVATDNPSLTNRYEKGKNPVRIVPSLSLELPWESNVLSDEHRTIIVTAECADRSKIRRIRDTGKECLVCGEDKIDFVALLSRLALEHNIEKVMVEGGGLLNWTLFSLGLVDEIILMQLPIIVGGVRTTSLADGTGVSSWDLVRHFSLSEVESRKRFLLLRYTR
jgi:5-amino-6-(5-phosphoribosylamino)uracil reductase